jgi:hypothetical protein
MALKDRPFCADCAHEPIAVSKGKHQMFNRRRRSAGSTGSDQPFCAMCGQSIRVDLTTGRCALGHRVAVQPAAVAPVDVPTGDVAPTEQIDGYDERIAAFTADRTYDPYAELVTQDAPIWDAADTQPVGALEDFMSWEDESASGTSALDFDTAELPLLSDPTASEAPVAPVDAASDGLLDELGDATAAYAKRL